MTELELLDLVQPAEGWYAVLGIKGESVIQELVATREEVITTAERFVRLERNVFFGVAKFETNENRQKENVKALKAFWLDIDCGEGKAEVNPKTGRPDGYIDQATGLTELAKFCKLIGLPKPVLVNSGRGIHAYWPLQEEVTRQEWEPVAKRFRELCVLHNLHVDGKVFEVARVLRIPGTFNFKDDPPTPVEVISWAEPVEFKEFYTLLGVSDPAEFKPKVKRELTELGKSLAESTATSFKKIMIRSAQGNGCAQLLYAYENQDSISEPLWWDALSVAQFCSDRDTAIHKLSNQHPDYDPADTEEKASHSKGPHTCAEFEKSNPGGCDECPFKGKIKSPIVLGKEIVEASEEDNVVTVEPQEEGEEQEVHKIPKYPNPFFRGKGGGIFMQLEDDEAEPVRVYEHDLYVVKRMRDPVLGDVVVMKLHLPRDGVKEFVVTNIAVSDPKELRKALASHGVLCATKKLNLLMAFIHASVKELQYKRRAETMRTQFGWADNDSKIIIGDREITKDGTFHSPPSHTTAIFADMMQPTGDIEKWKEVFNMYNVPGLEPHAFAALTAFGSPLLKFTGQSGAMINLIHKDSGTGKSTALFMANSVIGDPARLCTIWKDTKAAKFLRMGIMNNFANTIDEITNTPPAEFSDLIYGASQGRGADRSKASSNELRLNTTTWQSITLCSSNASFYEKLAALKNSPDGEMMRLIEYRIEPSSIIDPVVAKHMFDHQLRENYGHAGDVYAEWLINNLEEAKSTLQAIQAKIDKELKLTSRERFWSAVLACNITGGLIAKNLGLIDYDMKAIYGWATKMILGMREEVKPPVEDVASIIGDYINRHMQNILVVNDEGDRRAKMAPVPLLEPRGELLIRYEPDTKKLFIVAGPFKKYCVEHQINYKHVLEQLKKKGIFIDTMNKRMSKGMRIVSPGVHSLVFDCSINDFINMDDFVRPETENAGGEG